MNNWREKTATIQLENNKRYEIHIAGIYGIKKLPEVGMKTYHPYEPIEIVEKLLEQLEVIGLNYEKKYALEKLMEITKNVYNSSKFKVDEVVMVNEYYDPKKYGAYVHYKDLLYPKAKVKIVKVEIGPSNDIRYCFKPIGDDNKESNYVFTLYEEELTKV